VSNTDTKFYNNITTIVSIPPYTHHNILYYRQGSIVIDMSLVDQSDEPDKTKGEMTAALVSLANGVQVTYSGENVTARTGMISRRFIDPVEEARAISRHLNIYNYNQPITNKR